MRREGFEAFPFVRVSYMSDETGHVRLQEYGTQRQSGVVVPHRKVAKYPCTSALGHHWAQMENGPETGPQGKGLQWETFSIFD